MNSWRRLGSATLIAASALIGSIPLSIAQAPQRNAAPFEVVEASIADIHAAYKSGALTAHQLTQAYLDRIDTYDKNGPTINSVISLNPRALEDADRLDAAYKSSGPVGPLHGIPILVKDEIDTAGMATTMGTLVMKDYRPAKDAFVVDRLRKAGAVILGKTTLSEWARGDTYGSMFGVTRNPYDPERTVGGSSGGAGASLAANFSTIGLGEETLASIRRPGGWNAVVSMRPTPGLVSRSGMWDGYPTLAAQMGPMARTVRDLAILLDVMVAYDPEDPLTAAGVGKTDGSYTRFLDANGLKGARIGMLRESVGQSFRAGIGRLQEGRCGVREEHRGTQSGRRDHRRSDRHPGLQGAAGEAGRRSGSQRRGAHGLFRAQSQLAIQDAGRHRQFATAGAELLPFDDRAVAEPCPAGCRTIWRVSESARATDDQHPQGDGRSSARCDRAQDGRTSADADQGRDRSALREPERRALVQHVPRLFIGHHGAFRFHDDNLPVGITFFGRPYSEPTLLKLAYAYEQATHHRVPPKTTPPLANRER